MARLRAAQDHAARDAPRQARWASTNRFCTRSSTPSSREFGDAYPELKANRESIARSSVERRRALRRGADRRPAAARGRCSTRLRRGRRRGLPGELTPSSCTTRSGCRSTSSRTPPRPSASTFDKDGFEQAMEGQREKARARVRSRGRAGGGGMEAAGETAQQLDGSASRCSEATTGRR